MRDKGAGSASRKGTQKHCDIMPRLTPQPSEAQSKISKRLCSLHPEIFMALFSLSKSWNLFSLCAGLLQST